MNTLTQTSSSAVLATSQKAGSVRPHTSQIPDTTAAHSGSSRGSHWGRMLAATLLAAAVAALAVLANRLVSTWSDGDLLATWLALWGVVFAGSLLLAGTARRVAQRVMAGLDGWAQARAARRAASRFQRLARTDAQRLADVQANHDALAPMGAPGLDLPSWITLGNRPSLSTYVGWAQGRKYDVYYI